MDTMTILRAQRGRRTTKVHRAEGSLGYDAGYLFRAYEREVRYLGDIYFLLKDIASDTRSFIISGALREGLDWQSLYPRLFRRMREWHIRHFEERGEEPYLPFTARDRRWVCLDLDNLDLSRWEHEFETPWDAVPYIRAHLPIEFQRAGCVWQWSSSAGIDGKLKAHVWFWLNRPVCCFGWKEYFRKWTICPIDLALYNPVQPHYVNDPLFEGVVDPFADTHRLWWFEGDSVEVPDEVVNLDEWRTLKAKEQEEIKRKALAYKCLGVTNSRHRYANAALVSACENIASAVQGHRHNTILEESLATYRFVMEGQLDEQTWRAEITHAARTALPSNRHEEIGRILDGAIEVAS